MPDPERACLKKRCISNARPGRPTEVVYNHVQEKNDVFKSQYIKNPTVQDAMLDDLAIKERKHVC